jgi:uncharacterized phiE125 gp8 family phage protein
MNVTVTTHPPFEPVTLARVYLHLRLDAEGSPMSHPDDAMLSRHITTARQHVEQMTRRSLIEQTVRLSMSGFPVTREMTAFMERTDRIAAVQTIRLPRPPLLRVQSVSYYDASNVPQTVAEADYYITDEQVPELRFVSSFNAPTTYTRPDAVRVSYLAGYTPEGSPPTTQAEYAATVPAALQDAILLGVQLLYDALAPADREAIERTREALVQPYRIQHAL